jgi:hypothetical protein
VAVAGAVSGLTHSGSPARAQERSPFGAPRCRACCGGAVEWPH